MTKHMQASRRLDGTPLGKAGRKPTKMRRRGRRVVKPVPTSEPKRAKIFPMEQVPGILDWIGNYLPREKESAQLVFGLSSYAGLRVKEIAGLTMRDVTDHLGNVSNVIRIPKAISKYNKSREIPMHPCIAALLVAFKARHPGAQHLALNARGVPRGTQALCLWMHRSYAKMGLHGCSSHSGRRSLITYLAKNHGRLGMSLKDVQLIAGHARLETTEAYIEPSADLHRLVNSVPWAVSPLELGVPVPSRPTEVPALVTPARLPFSWEAGYATPAYGSKNGGRS